jgi:hypothetical protein
MIELLRIVERASEGVIPDDAVLDAWFGRPCHDPGVGWTWDMTAGGCASGSEKRSCRWIR